jgi:hypothetical protein
MPSDYKWMTPVFEEVIKLLQRGWCKDACAVNRYGRIVQYTDKKAVRFSLTGAIHRALLDKKITQSGSHGNLVAVIQLTEGRDVVQINEQSESVEQIIVICRRAMEYADRYRSESGNPRQKRPKAA